MGGPDAPPDRSVELRQLELDAAGQERARQEELDRQREEKLAALRSSALEGGRGSASNYFVNQGLDPDAYASTIEGELTRLLNTIAPDDPNPGAYFGNVGAQAYDLAETGERNQHMRALDNIFAPNFETRRIPFTLDDPILSSIQSEQRSEADTIIKNMLDRGVITDAGYGTASADLDKQAPGVFARLNEVGTGQLGSGQNTLREIANNARSTASQSRLGSPFDPYEYSSDADKAFTDFLNNLGTNIRAALPGQLFQTSGLAAIAGAGQGAQNTAFNPRAAAGILGEEEEEDNRTNTSSPF